MALGMNLDAFASSELHLAGAFCQTGHKGAQVLDRHVLLASESPSYVAVLDTDFLFRKAEHGSRLASRVIDSLVRGIYLDPAVFQRDRYRTLRFKEGVLGPWGGELLRKDVL